MLDPNVIIMLQINTKLVNLSNKRAGDVRFGIAMLQEVTAQAFWLNSDLKDKVGAMEAQPSALEE